MFPHSFDDFNRNDDQLMSTATSDSSDDYEHAQVEGRVSDATNGSKMAFVTESDNKMMNPEGNGRLRISGHSSYPALSSYVDDPNKDERLTIRRRIECSRAASTE